MRLLVTGGLGFIGSHFVEYEIQKNCEIEVWDSATYAGSLENLSNSTRESVKIKILDISDNHIVKSAIKNSGYFDLIVNFAAESHVDRSIINPNKFIISNVIGVCNLLEIVREGFAGGFIQISTDEVYGSILNGSWDENSLLAPRSPYSASKASADLLTLSYGSTFGLTSVITRSANNFGPKQSMEKFIPKVIHCLKNSLPIPVYGDGLYSREWIYVNENVNVISELIHRFPSHLGIYNIGGFELTNIELINMIAKFMSIDNPNIQYVPDRLGHDRRYSVDSTRVLTVLNKSSSGINLIGFQETIDWYLNNSDWVSRSLAKIKEMK